MRYDKKLEVYMFQGTTRITSLFWQMSSAEGIGNLAYVSELPDDPNVEPVSAEVREKTAVRIRNLEKTFNPRGKKPVKAVDGMLH